MWCSKLVGWSKWIPLFWRIHESSIFSLHVQLLTVTFPIEPSPRNLDESKLFVASFNSSKENNRQTGAPCVPSFAAWEINPKKNRGKVITLGSHMHHRLWFTQLWFSLYSYILNYKIDRVSWTSMPWILNKW